jgi:citronellol/citronellal dehydrogenase
MKQFDLMHQVNTRGTFLTTKLCLPHLRRAANPHVLTLSPPLDMSADWFAPNVAYTLTKFGMSMVILGMAEEFRAEGIACNALWPRTPIATSAVEFAVQGGKELLQHCRTPEIMADAAHCILTQASRSFTGRFCLDDSVLHALAHIENFDHYRVSIEDKLATDMFVRTTDAMPPTVAATMQGS